jgi:hypothetical protein
VNDTSPEIARIVRERYARMEPVQRFLIGVSMFESARAIARASFPAGLSPEQVRRALCERLYPELAAEFFGADEPGRADVTLKELGQISGRTRE